MPFAALLLCTQGGAFQMATQEPNLDKWRIHNARHLHGLTLHRRAYTNPIRH
jgi:hypothetical protein